MRPGAKSNIKRANAQCAVFGSKGTAHETRFELADDSPASDGSGFALRDFVRYRAAVHASLEWGEQNSYMDEHLGLCVRRACLPMRFFRRLTLPSLPRAR